MSDYDIEFEEQEFTAQFNGTTASRIFALIKPHWVATVVFLVTIGLTSSTDAIFTFISKQMVDNGIIARDVNELMRLATIYASLILLQAGLVFTFIYTAGILGERIRYDMRKTLFNHLQDLSLSYFSQNPVGWLIARVTSDTERVADMVTWGLLDMTWAAMNIITSLSFMLYINWRLALIVLLILPILVVIAARFQVVILKEFRTSRKFNSKITAAYNENITGVRVVKALNREDENMREFSALTGQMYKASYRAAWLSALFLPVVQMISALALGAIVYYSGLQAQYGGMTIGGIQAFVAYLTFMMWPIQDLARVYAEIQHAIASAERIFSLVDKTPEVQDRPGALDPGTLRGAIEFDHVDFYYEDLKPVLADFTLKVQPGEMIALVGPTGGGKTTIVNLLCRFFEPKKGVVRINGRDYTEYTLHAIQSRVGIVLQTPHLFSGTIRENLRYGRLDATNEEIEQAAKLAGAHDFIVTFEKGYEMEVGEGGNLLSTGQKQLISLARAVLARPEIFIMDEATSSVDTLTEALIQRGMEHLMKGRTSFIIAHRLSTIKRASRIVVIEGGRIVEMGTHAELLKLRGHYYNLYTKQFRHDRTAEYGGILEEVVTAAAAD
jgi:ATP-binding cassette subfamily B protein